MIARSICITGRVQNVGFRAFVERTALRYGVHGEVWNTKDDAVEAHVQHPDESILNQFVEALRSGPGYVREITVTEATVQDIVGFRIGDTR